MKGSNEIFIGYIPDKKINVNNDLLILEPLLDLENIVHRINETTQVKDGFIFPVLTSIKYQHDIENGNLIEKEVSRSPLYQPSIFKFYSTHKFILREMAAEFKLKEFTKNPSFFLLQIIGYVSGYRIMPSDFWFDGKIPSRPTNNIICTNYDSVLMKSYELWSRIPEKSRNDLIGFFYMFNRAPSYHWPFEKFTHDFMILDSVMRFYNTHIKPNSLSNKNRYYNFLDQMGISYNRATLKFLIELRNNLFHEVKWGSGIPCFADDDNVFYKVIAFRKIVHAVLGKLLGLEGDYFNSNWDCLGTALFDVK